MPTTIDHFDALTQRGIKVIPLRENSKVPMCKGWTDNWDCEVARSKLATFPDANIGILLGDIIDVEGDSEEANRIVLDLIGDYPHPCYQSTKSIHHLFLTPDPQLAHFRWKEIEFRGIGHQSVLPPSQHQGFKYKWLKAFRFPVPHMPDRLLDFYMSKAQRKRPPVLKPGHVRVWCGGCEEQCYLHGKRWSLELRAFKLLGEKWQCRGCRTVDLRPACRLLRGGAPDEVVLTNVLQIR